MRSATGAPRSTTLRSLPSSSSPSPFPSLFSFSSSHASHDLGQNSFNSRFFHFRSHLFTDFAFTQLQFCLSLFLYLSDWSSVHDESLSLSSFSSSLTPTLLLSSLLFGADVGASSSGNTSISVNGPRHSPRGRNLKFVTGSSAIVDTVSGRGGNASTTLRCFSSCVSHPVGPLLYVRNRSQLSVFFLQPFKNRSIKSTSHPDK